MLSQSIRTVADAPIHYTFAASEIGLVDTIYSRDAGVSREVVGDNVSWKAIRRTLTYNHSEAAFANRPALLLSHSADNILSAAYALESLQCNPVYIAGFEASANMRLCSRKKVELVQLKAYEKSIDPPFVIISGIRASNVKGPLNTFLSQTKSFGGFATKGIYLDSVDSRPNNVTSSTGWKTYNAGDVNAWRTVEYLETFLGQTVPFNLVKMASTEGRVRL